MYFGNISWSTYVQPHQYKALLEIFWIVWLDIDISWNRKYALLSSCFQIQNKWELFDTGVSYLLWGWWKCLNFKIVSIQNFLLNFWLSPEQIRWVAKDISQKDCDFLNNLAQQDIKYLGPESRTTRWLTAKFRSYYKTSGENQDGARRIN